MLIINLQTSDAMVYLLFSFLPQAFGKDDCVGCYLDLDHGTVSFSKNGKSLGKAFDLPSHLVGATFYPAVVLKVS